MKVILFFSLVAMFAQGSEKPDTHALRDTKKQEIVAFLEKCKDTTVIKNMSENQRREFIAKIEIYRQELSDLREQLKQKDNGLLHSCTIL